MPWKISLQSTQSIIALVCLNSLSGLAHPLTALSQDEYTHHYKDHHFIALNASSVGKILDF